MQTYQNYTRHLISVDKRQTILCRRHTFPKRTQMQALANVMNDVTQSQINSYNMHLLIAGYKLQSPEYPMSNSQTMWSWRGRKIKVWIFSPSYKWEQNIHRSTCVDKVWVVERLMENTIKRLTNLAIHPTYNRQTKTLLWIQGSACWQEPDTAVSWEALPELDKYRGGCSQPTIRLSLGSLMEEDEKGMKEVWGLQPHEGSKNANWPESHGLDHQLNTTHGGTHVSSCIYSLVGCQCEKWSLGLRGLNPTV